MGLMTWFRISFRVFSLAHNDSLRLLRLVLQDAHLASASLLPNVLAHLVTVFIFLEGKGTIWNA